MALKTDDVRRGSQLLAEVLLGNIERMAERSAAQMQELLPAYARVPRQELIPVVLASTRDLLQAIHDAGADPSLERVDQRASGAAPVREGITSDEMLHGRRIGLQVVREEAYAAARELDISEEALLEFVEAELRLGEARMHAPVSAHHAEEIRELTRMAEEQAALRRVATLVARGAPSARLFAVVAEQVASVLRAPFVGIARYEADGTATQLASVGEPEQVELFPVGRRWSLEGTNVLEEVRTSGRPARINDHAGLEGEIAGTIRRAGIGSTVASPIVVAGELWGATVVSSPRAAPLSADAESRLTDFSELLATAISNANARAEVERLAEEHAALRRVAMMIAQEPDREEVFVNVTGETGPLLGAEAGSLYRFEADGYCTVAGSWGKFRESFAIGTRWKFDADSVTSFVARTRRSVRLGKDELGSGWVAAEVGKLGLRSVVASAILVQGRVWGTLIAATSRTSLMPAEAESRAEHFAELVATAVSNLHARAEVQRLAQEQAALRRVATIVAHELPPEKVFAAVAAEVGLLLGVESVSIERCDPDGGCTVVAVWGKLREMVEVGSRWRLETDTDTPPVQRAGRVEGFEGYEHAWRPVKGGPRELGLRSTLASPVFVSGQLWGAIFAASSETAPMPADAESRIAQFTELMVTAIANAQTRSDLAASRSRIIAAADDERRRVVRDLHDGAHQRLGHTIVTLKLARGALERDRDDAADLVHEALHHAQAANDELRELAHGILPSVLTHAGLGAAIGAVASRMAIPVDVDVSVGRLEQEVEATAYFVVAEALTEAARRSSATWAKVTARIDGRALKVEISDDGVDGDPRDPRDGRGMVGVRDRLAVLGGSLEVESSPPSGTVIAASIPVG